MTDVSPGDNAERIFAFRHLPRQDVVVLVGASTAGITRQWAEEMAYHLLFGIPATLALVALSWFAVLQARRESIAYAQLREETALRESTEHAFARRRRWKRSAASPAASRTISTIC